MDLLASGDSARLPKTRVRRTPRSPHASRSNDDLDGDDDDCLVVFDGHSTQEQGEGAARPEDGLVSPAYALIKVDAFGLKSIHEQVATVLESGQPLIVLNETPALCALIESQEAQQGTAPASKKQETAEGVDEEEPHQDSLPARMGGSSQMPVLDYFGPPSEAEISTDATGRVGGGAGKKHRRVEAVRTTHEVQRTSTTTTTNQQTRAPAHPTVHRGRLQCTHCEKAISVAMQGQFLRLHARSHESNEPYKCSSCGAHFAFLTTAKRHCDGCSPGSFVQPNELLAAADEVVNERCFPAFFPQKNALTSSRAAAAKKAKKCGCCGKSVQKADMAKHVAADHFTDCLLKCTSCIAFFLTTAARKRHWETEHPGFVQTHGLSPMQPPIQSNPHAVVSAYFADQ